MLLGSMDATTLLSPPDDVFIIRQSTIGQLQLCGMREYYRNHDGYVDYVSEPLLFGILFHAAVEQILLDDMSIIQVLDQDNLRMLAEVEETNRQVAISNLDKFHWDNLRAALVSWYDTLWPSISSQELLVVEEKLYAPLSDKVWLQGSPDVITRAGSGSVVGRDWKTAGRGWKPEKAEASLQPALYSYLVEQNYGYKVDEWVFHVFNRRAHDWEHHAVGGWDIDAAIQMALRYAEMLQNGLFVPNPTQYGSFSLKRAWYCSARFCPAWNVCEYKTIINDDKDIDELRTEELAW
jgi:hypothetical protein